MTALKHRRPANLLTTQLPTTTVAANEIAIHQASQTLFTVISGAAVILGGIPITSDGFGGFKQFTRGIDLTFDSQGSAVTATCPTGTSLQVVVPSLLILWHGVYTPVNTSTINQTITGAQYTSSTWSVILAYNYGLGYSLTTVGVAPAREQISVADITIASGVCTVSPHSQNTIGHGGYYVYNGASAATAISYSNSAGTVPF